MLITNRFAEQLAHLNRPPNEPEVCDDSSDNTLHSFHLKVTNSSFCLIRNQNGLSKETFLSKRW